MNEASELIKLSRGAGYTPKKIVITEVIMRVERVRMEGIITLVPSSAASLKNIKTITLMLK